MRVTSLKIKLLAQAYILRKGTAMRVASWAYIFKTPMKILLSRRKKHVYGSERIVIRTN